jgi:hypothetical protein
MAYLAAELCPTGLDAAAQALAHGEGDAEMYAEDASYRAICRDALAPVIAAYLAAAQSSATAGRPRRHLRPVRSS